MMATTKKLSNISIFLMGILTTSKLEQNLDSRNEFSEFDYYFNCLL